MNPATINLKDSEKGVVHNAPFNRDYKVYSALKTCTTYELDPDGYLGYAKIQGNKANKWQLFLKLRDTSTGESVLYNPSSLLDKIITANDQHIIETTGLVNRAFKEYVKKMREITQKQAIDFLADLIGDKKIKVTMSAPCKIQVKLNNSEQYYTQTKSLLNLNLI